MVVGPKNTLFLDEISTGLDSSTTFLIVRCMRNFVHTLQVHPCAPCSLVILPLVPDNRPKPSHML